MSAELPESVSIGLTPMGYAVATGVDPLHPSVPYTLEMLEDVVVGRPGWMDGVCARMREMQRKEVRGD